MSKTSSQTLPPGTTPQYANLHKWLQRALYVCLTALVIEGALTFPLIAIWYGWPQLTLQEICTEFERHRFSDETRECIWPYPLFAKAEGAGQTTAQDRWGVQPKPLYKTIEFRQFVRNKEARLAHEAAAQQSAAESPGEPFTPDAAPLN